MVGMGRRRERHEDACSRVSAAQSSARTHLGEGLHHLRIAGHADWYLPSQDELEIIYRNLKPPKP